MCVLVCAGGLHTDWRSQWHNQRWPPLPTSKVSALLSLSNCRKELEENFFIWSYINLSWISISSLRGGILCRIWRAIQRHRERLRSAQHLEEDAWWDTLGCQIRSDQTISSLITTKTIIHVIQGVISEAQPTHTTYQLLNSKFHFIPLIVNKNKISQLIRSHNVYLHNCFWPWNEYYEYIINILTMQSKEAHLCTLAALHGHLSLLSPQCLYMNVQDWLKACSPTLDQTKAL